jgi:hypothetical protein
MKIMLSANTTWREALTSNNPRHYIIMALLFNVLTLLQLVKLILHHPGEHTILLFFGVMLALLLLLNYYGWGFSKQMQDDKRLGYLGYRLYLTGLGIAFAALAFFNLIK